MLHLFQFSAPRLLPPLFPISTVTVAIASVVAVVIGLPLLLLLLLVVVPLDVSTAAAAAARVVRGRRAMRRIRAEAGVSGRQTQRGRGVLESRQGILREKGDAAPLSPAPAPAPDPAPAAVVVIFRPPFFAARSLANFANANERRGGGGLGIER
jgi:hypothetical protein